MLTNFKKWPMESLSTRMPKAPMRDGLSEATLDLYDLTEDASTGMLLESVPETIPANSLPPDEFEALIKAHQDRIAAELARSQILDRGERKPSDEYRLTKIKCPNLPGKLKYKDLRVVNCARCGKTLLGESQEELRAVAVAKGLRTAANFPPPVAARLHAGRPYCGTCAAAYDDG